MDSALSLRTRTLRLAAISTITLASLIVPPAPPEIQSATVALCSTATDASPLAIDDTDCNNVELNDLAFAEPIIRDESDRSYGALSNPALYPLGGGPGYQGILPRPATVVRTVDELRTALRNAVHTSPSTIYVDDAAEIDLSYCARTPDPNCRNDPRSAPPRCSDYSLVVPAGTTLGSGRGRGGSRGARLFSRTFTTCPLFDVAGPGVRITGVRLHGPDSSIENDETIHCDRESTGIRILSRTAARWSTQIDNNELTSWPHVAVHIAGVQGVRVHHNVIQFNRRQEHNATCGAQNAYGLGYGVAVGPGSAVIEANVFDHNRHDIASNGAPGTFYTAAYNLVLDGAVQHSFDVHGGADRKDCTNIAGSAFVIHHNTFLQDHRPAVVIRGIPLRGAWLDHNETRDESQRDAFVQLNTSGNFTVGETRTNVNHFPAWRVSYSGTSFWQWQRFDATTPSEVATGDFDGDGAIDAMRAAPTGWEWSRSARADWQRLNTLSTPVSALVVGDFVGSPSSDIVRYTTGRWEVSEGGTSPWSRLYEPAPPISDATFGDFGGDGRTDALFTDGSQWSIVDSFSPLSIRRYQQPYRLADLRFGNFVGDAKLDVFRSTGGEWLVWDSSSQQWSHLGFSGVPLSQLTLADFDGDGFTDIARTADGRWQVSWGGRSTWQTLNWSIEDLRRMVVADFNGDRKADVLTTHAPVA